VQQLALALVVCGALCAASMDRDALEREVMRLVQEERQLALEAQEQAGVVARLRMYPGWVPERPVVLLEEDASPKKATTAGGHKPKKESQIHKSKNAGKAAATTKPGANKKAEAAASKKAEEVATKPVTSMADVEKKEAKKVAKVQKQVKKQVAKAKEKKEQKALANAPTGASTKKLRAAIAETKAKKEAAAQAEEKLRVANKKKEDIKKIDQEVTKANKVAAKQAAALKSEAKNVAAPLNGAAELQKAQDVANAAKTRLQIAVAELKKAKDMYAIKSAKSSVEHRLIGIASSQRYQRYAAFRTASRVAAARRSSKLAMARMKSSSAQAMAHDKSAIAAAKRRKKQNEALMNVVHSKQCGHMKLLHEELLDKLAEFKGFPLALAKCRSLMHAQRKACGSEPTPWLKAKYAVMASKRTIAHYEHKLSRDTANNKISTRQLPVTTTAETHAAQLSSKMQQHYGTYQRKEQAVRRKAKPFITAAAVARSTYHTMQHKEHNAKRAYNNALQHTKLVAFRTAKEKRAKQAAAIKKAQKDAKVRGCQAHITQASTAYEKAKEDAATKATAAAAAAKRAAAAVEAAAASVNDQAAAKRKDDAENVATNAAQAAKLAQTVVTKAKLALDKAKKTSPCSMMTTPAEQKAAEKAATAPKTVSKPKGEASKAKQAPKDKATSKSDSAPEKKAKANKPAAKEKAPKAKPKAKKPDKKAP
jgi:hypothetical protein